MEHEKINFWYYPGKGDRILQILQKEYASIFRLIECREFESGTCDQGVFFTSRLIKEGLPVEIKGYSSGISYENIAISDDIALSRILRRIFVSMFNNTRYADLIKEV